MRYVKISTSMLAIVALVAVVPSCSSTPGPVVSVTADYPGADARVVADTVAAPIEQQVNGVEKAVWLRSRSTSDGHYTLQVQFRKGTDPHLAMQLVQSRVNLALPILPDILHKQGVTTRLETPLALVLVLHCVDRSRDPQYLADYARLNLLPKLSQMSCAGQVELVGAEKSSLHVRVDLEKLRSLDLTASDVAVALKEELAELATADKQPDPKAIGRIVVKKHPGGAIYVSDVASLQVGPGKQQSFAYLNGEAAVAFLIHAAADTTPAGFEKEFRKQLSPLQSELPQGLTLDPTFVSQNHSQVLLAVTFPDGASLERASESLRRFEPQLRQIPGVKGSLILSENRLVPFKGGPCILLPIEAPSARDTIRVKEAIRRLADAELRDAAVRIGDLPPADGEACPIEMAVIGPEDQPLREFADAVVAKCQKNRELTEVSAERSQMPSLSLDIDRNRCRSAGVGVSDVLATIQLSDDEMELGNSPMFGQHLSVELETGREARWASDNLAQVKVRAADGTMVALNQLVTVRDTLAPACIDRYDMYPILPLYVTPAAGASTAAAWSKCKAAAADARTELGLSNDYRLQWLSSAPEPGR